MSYRKDLNATGVSSFDDSVSVERYEGAVQLCIVEKDGDIALCYLKPSEARELAAALIKAAEEAEV